MDLRSPGEYAHGAFPGATSLPLMTDEERAQVGTCYKQRGQAAAIELGHRLVAGRERERRIADWRAFAQAASAGVPVLLARWPAFTNRAAVAG